MDEQVIGSPRFVHGVRALAGQAAVNLVGDRLKLIPIR
jgi:hypothetical protein